MDCIGGKQYTEAGDFDVIMSLPAQSTRSPKPTHIIVMKNAEVNSVNLMPLEVVYIAIKKRVTRNENTLRFFFL